MTFAFSQNRGKVVRNIANLATFVHGGISGKQGGTTRLNKLPREYALGLADAVYVVYCYDTPIAWVTMADDATEEGRVNFLPDWQYSATTTYYQGLVAEAWGDKIADPNPRYSKQSNRGTARGRSSDERYGRVPRQSPAQRREAGYAPRPAQAPVETRVSVLTDPRYADPDWVPPEFRRDEQEVFATDLRDWDRVRTNQGRGWTPPAHP